MEQILALELTSFTLVKLYHKLSLM